MGSPDSRTIPEINDLMPDKIGQFVRADRFEGAGSLRVATWVYGPDHAEDAPAGWAVSIDRRCYAGTFEVYVNVLRYSPAEGDYTKLRTLADDTDFGGDPLADAVDLVEDVLATVSEAADPDLLEAIGVDAEVAA